MQWNAELSIKVLSMANEGNNKKFLLNLMYGQECSNQRADSALWAGSVVESPCLYVCASVTLRHLSHVTCHMSPITFIVSHYFFVKFSRPGRSPGLLYKQPRDWLIDSFIQWVSEPFPPTVLRRGHAQTVRVSTSSYKIDYIIVIKNFLNPKGHQNPISGSNVTAILLKGWILPIGGASARQGLPCSLRSRLVLFLNKLGIILPCKSDCHPIFGLAQFVTRCTHI